MLRLLNALAAQGIDSFVLTARHDSSPFVERLEGTMVIRVPVWGPKRLRVLCFALALFPLLIVFWPKYDAVVCAAVDWSTLLAIFYAKVLGKRAILRPTIMGACEPSAVRRRKLGAIQLDLYRLADAIVSINPLFVHELLEAGIETSRIWEIPNGVDLNTFSPSKREEKVALRKRLEIPQDAIVVSFVGSIVPRKGVDLLIDAWKFVAGRHTRVILLLIGLIHLDHPMAGPFYEKLLDFIKEESLESTVRFTNKVDNVADYLKSSDIFVFPSQREGLPNALLEAMSCGIPCIITPFKGFSEFIGRPGRELLLVSPNAAALANAIIELIENSEMRIRIGREARKRVEEAFSFKKVVDDYGALFRGSLK